MLKSQRGLTFLICIITIAVLVIIGAAVLNSGITTFRNSKVKVYTSEMRTIQEKIDLYIERSELDPRKDIKAIGCSVTDESQTQTYELIQGWLQEHPDLIDEADYAYIRYIDSSTIKLELGLEDIARPVFYNYKDKKLYSFDPVTVYKTGGQTVKCYCLDDVKNAY